MDENLLSFSAAIAKTAKLKQERHNTVHVACQTDDFVVSFSCVEKSRATGAVQVVVFGVFVFWLNSRRGGGRPHCVCERLVVVIRSVWIFALCHTCKSGFQKVTQAQSLRADRQAFVRIIEQFTGSLKTFAGAGKPLDPLIERLEADMTVTHFMLPIPAGHGRSGSSTDKADKRRSTLKVNKARTSIKKGAAKGAGKRPKGKKRDPVPQCLKGMHSRTPQGDPIALPSI